MHDLLPVYVLKRFAGLPHIFDRLFDRNSGLPALLEERPEVDPPNQVHHEVPATRRREVIDDPDHARMLEAGQQSCLDVEALVVVRVGGLLERDFLAALGLDRAVDGAHRARGDRLDYVVAAAQGAAQDLRSGSGLSHSSEHTDIRTAVLPHSRNPRPKVD